MADGPEEASIRRATRADVAAIVRLLADDPPGATRERFADPLPAALDNPGPRRISPSTQSGRTRGPGALMTTTQATSRLTSFAPQFLVDDLARAIAYYERLGFAFGEPWDGFYAIGMRDGLELHLKEGPRYDAERQHRREHEHLDAAAGVDGIEAFYEQCVARGATILKPLAETAWGTKDFYLEDPDGNVIAFGGRPSGE